MGKEPPEARGRKRGAFPPPLRRSCAALGNGAALPGRLLLVRRLRLLTFRARGAIFLTQAGRRLAFGMDEEPPEARRRERGAFPQPSRRSCAALGNGGALPLLASRPVAFGFSFSARGGKHEKRPSSNKVGAHRFSRPFRSPAAAMPGARREPISPRSRPRARRLRTTDAEWSALPGMVSKAGTARRFKKNYCFPLVSRFR